MNRSLVLAFLVVLSVITFLDRLAIAAAGPRMQGDLGLNPEQWGWVLGVFVFAYGAFEIPTGAMGDRWGQRRVITRIVVWWSAFTALTGAVSGYRSLLATRFLFGVGEAGAYPNMSGCIARWFPTTERARAQGFVWAGSRAGGALAPLLVVPLQTEFGWRATFWVLGAVGLIWSAAWWVWYRDPGVPPAGPAASHRLPWRQLAASRQLLLIVCMYGSYAWGSWFYFSWLHTYLVRGRGFSESAMAAITAFTFAIAAVANASGGYLGDAMVRRFGVTRGRRYVGCGSLAAGSVVLLATALTSDPIVAAALLALGLGVTDLMLPSAWAICIDIGGRHTGAVTGAMNTAGQVGGFLCTVIFGAIVHRTGNYHLPLFVIGAMLALGALLFSRIDPVRPLLPESDEFLHDQQAI